MSSSSNQPRFFPTRTNRRKLGRAYEERAAAYYQSQGFTIREKSWQAGHKEIDLIVRKDDLLVFVEVKAARSTAFGHPAEWVSKVKQRKLIAAAEQYLATHEIAGCDIRFDVVCFVRGEMECFPGAFQTDEDLPG